MTLTPRQLDIARLLSDGLSVSEVAAELSISGHTVKAHMAAARDRIGWRGRPIVVMVRYYERFHVELAGSG